LVHVDLLFLFALASVLAMFEQMDDMKRRATARQFSALALTFAR